MDLPEPTPIRIGDWIAHPSVNHLSHNGTSVRVAPKVMQVLVCLTQHPGEAVTRDALFAEVWRDTIVTDDVLNRAISELRKVFGDDPQQPRYIETLPKVGYRLLASVAYLPPSVPPVGSPANGAARKGAHEQPQKRWRPMWLGIAALFLIVAGGIGWQALQPKVPTVPLRPRPVTAMPHQESQPRLSADGQQVVFAWQGTAGDNWDIYVKDVRGDAMLRLTTDAADDFSPVWSPSGREVAFIRRQKDGCQLLAVSAIGGAERHLAPCHPTTRPFIDWSPDGRWLVTAEQAAPDESFSLFLTEIETGARRRLTETASQHWGDTQPKFSPDGRQVAYATFVSMAVQQLNTVAVVGGTPRQHWQGVPLRGHTWIPDGAALIFATEREEASGLWRLPLDGRAPTWLGVAAADAAQPTYAAGRLLYEVPIALHRIQAQALADSMGPMPWAPATRSDEMPQFSPDGTQVAFISDRAGPPALWLAAADGTRPRQLTKVDHARLAFPRWSPDGARIAFEIHQQDRVSVQVLHVESGQVQAFPGAAGNTLAPSWSRDGAFLYAGSNRTGDWQIWRIAASDGAATQVTRAGGYGSAEAASGLYVTRFERAGLWHVAAPDAVPVLVAGTDTLDFRENWGIVGETLFVLAASGEASQLHLIDLPTQTWQTHKLGGGSPGYGATLSPDGQTLLYVALEREESDLMLVEGLDR